LVVLREEGKLTNNSALLFDSLPGYDSFKEVECMHGSTEYIVENFLIEVWFNMGFRKGTK